MKKKDVIETLLKNVTNKDGQLDEDVINKWLLFMFENDPIAAALYDFCKPRGIVPLRMYQLIALGFMCQNTRRRTEEWLRANTAKVGKETPS